MPTQYTIRLNLGGNLVQRLHEAEQIMDRINTKATQINKGLPGGVGSTVPPVAPGVAPRNNGVVRPPRYRYIPPAARPGLNRYYLLSRQFGNTGTRSSFNSSFNNAFRQLHRFRSEFFRNMFSISGWRRNFGNFFGSLNSFGGALAKAIPLIRFATATITAYATAWAVPKLIGGAVYSIGSKAMNSQSMTEAISNSMQLSMARRGLGADYDRTYSQASRMAAEYGYSRSGMVSMINTLSGFEVNGSELGTDIATDIARITGKVAQLGGRPYDIVGLNMQQLLAANKPNMRDIRELINAAPILSKYALDEMRNTGVSGGDPREWLKDRGNMIRALYRLDDEMQPPAVSAARGRVQLARENFWIGLSGMDKFWQDVASAGERMWAELLGKFERWYSNYDSAKFQKNLSEFVDGVGTIAEALLGLGEGLVGFANIITDIRNIFANLDVWIAQKIYGIASSGFVNNVRELSGNPYSRFTQFATLFGWMRHNSNPSNSQVDTNEEGNLLVRSWAKESVGNYLSSKEGARAYGLNRGTPEANAIARTKAEDFLIGRYEGRYRGDIVSNMFSVPELRDSLGNGPSILRNNGALSRTVGSGAQIDSEAVANMFSQIANLFSGKGVNGIGNQDSKKIEDLTAGSKSLIINFNAPITSMPTTIQNASNPTQLLAEIDRRINDSTVRGLQIAIANASRMG